MTREEFENKRKELTKIFLIETDAGPRLDKLTQLAREVGVSITLMGQPPIVSPDLIPMAKNLITETEIVHNIELALQTWTMINMCKTASRNFWIAIIASLIAFLSMLAAWVAVLSK